MTEPTPWWRDAVVYQIYPRSFADGNGDGIGDIAGMTAHLDHLAGLGVDAIWVSPWYHSPMEDGGYDVSDHRDVHPDFGTLDDARDFLAKAHALGMRVIVDLVVNHTSRAHPWFQAALAAAPGSPERARYHFRDGTGPNGALPPSNWGSMFGGGAWERVPDDQWYLHTFAVGQPDLNWDSPEVRADVDDILRFWFDLGVDGFRIDVADGMVKDTTFPDALVDPQTGLGTLEKYVGHPSWDQPGLDALQRHWRTIADSYADTEQGPRIFVGETILSPLDRLCRYVMPGRLHTTFNVDHILCGWDAPSLRAVIDESLRAHTAVGAPATWVLGNHDVTRVVTRYGKPHTGSRYTAAGMVEGTYMDSHDQNGRTPTDVALGRRRARAAALVEFALPGGCYVYQGDELGLAEVEDLPDELRQDPVARRTDFPHKGRDGCRVPLPWTSTGPSLGFGAGPGWLPQPTTWGGLSAQAQADDPTSTLSLYRTALLERRRNPALGDGTLRWHESARDVLDFSREPGFRCVANMGSQPVVIPAGRVIVASAPLVDGLLPPDAAVWLAV